MMFTKEEKVFLLEILDQISVRGVVAKTMVVIIMGKLSDSTKVMDEPNQDGSIIKPNEEDTDVPTADSPAS